MGACECCNESLGILWLAEDQLMSQEGLCSMMLCDCKFLRHSAWTQSSVIQLVGPPTKMSCSWVMPVGLIRLSHMIMTAWHTFASVMHMCGYPVRCWSSTCRSITESTASYPHVIPWHDTLCTLPPAGDEFSAVWHPWHAKSNHTAHFNIWWCFW